MRKLFWRIVDRVRDGIADQLERFLFSSLQENEEQRELHDLLVVHHEGIDGSDLRGLDVQQIEREFKSFGWSEYGPLYDSWQELQRTNTAGGKA